MYTPNPARYQNPGFFRRCGRSGLQLPVLSLGLWHNFGAADASDNIHAIVRRAFDAGMTHFDLANNYGPPAGAAEETFARILRTDFASHRDELVVSTKAGYHMWPGPYGEWGSRKHMLSSLEASLRRLGLDTVDIFYSHRFDPHTPLEETMGALDYAVRSGKARYVGLSNYNVESTVRAVRILRELGTPCRVHQLHYNMFDRTPETGLLETIRAEGVGGVLFSPLAQGLLTDRYLAGIPADSRAGHDPRFLRPEHITDTTLAKARALDEVARARGQTLAQMAIAWVLRQPAATTALIGASRPTQIDDCVEAVKNLDFAATELAAIEQILGPARERVA